MNWPAEMFELRRGLWSIGVDGVVKPNIFLAQGRDLIGNISRDQTKISLSYSSIISCFYSTASQFTNTRPIYKKYITNLWHRNCEWVAGSDLTMKPAGGEDPASQNPPTDDRLFVKWLEQQPDSTQIQYVTLILLWVFLTR